MYMEQRLIQKELEIWRNQHSCIHPSCNYVIREVPGLLPKGEDRDVFPLEQILSLDYFRFGCAFSCFCQQLFFWVNTLKLQVSAACGENVVNGYPPDSVLGWLLICLEHMLYAQRVMLLCNFIFRQFIITDKSTEKWFISTYYHPFNLYSLFLACVFLDLFICLLFHEFTSMSLFGLCTTYILEKVWILKFMGIFANASRVW